MQYIFNIAFMLQICFSDYSKGWISAEDSDAASGYHKYISSLYFGIECDEQK